MEHRNRIPTTRSIVVLWGCLLVPGLYAEYLVREKHFGSWEILWMILLQAERLLVPLLVREATFACSVRLRIGARTLVFGSMVMFMMFRGALAFESRFGEPGLRYFNLTSAASYSVDILLLYICLWCLRRAYYSKEITTHDSQQVVQHDSPSADRLPSELSERPLDIGSGDGLHALVSRKILGRADAAERSASVALVVLVSIVFCGGGATVGMWFAQFADNVSDLAKASARVASMSTDLELGLEMIGKQQNASTEMVETAKGLAQISNKLTTEFKPSGTKSDIVSELLAKVARNMETKWEDIAVRGTIALLTIFLVQIVFQVYRYHRRLASLLSDKAEALAVIADDSDARHQLALQLSGIVCTPVPGFGADPRTPFEVAAGMARGVISRKEDAR